MGEKDTKAKEYLSDNSRFADLCNYVLFQGEQIIKAETPFEKDSTEVLSILVDGREEQFQKWRDLIKGTVIKRNKDMVFVLIGIENQSDIHYAMPVKNMIYDALNYGSQVKKTAKRHRKNHDKLTPAEFLSGFRKDDKLTPVITITLYWGADKWDGPRTLHDMLEHSDEALIKFIPDYHINLVVPEEIDDFKKFRTTLGEVLETIKVSNDKEQMRQLIFSNPAFQKMDNESVAAINTFLGTNIPLNKTEEVTDMCKAWDDLMNEGIEKGIEKGIKKGIEKGRINIIADFLLNGGTEEQAKEMLKASENEVTSAKELLTVKI